MSRWLFPDSCLMVFAKAPEPGKVKTRLLPAITAEEASSLHSRLVFETLELCHREPLCPVQLWCSPSPEHAFFTDAAKQFPISLERQSGEDLGARMADAFATNQRRYAALVLIGCDCPSLGPSDLIASLTALHQRSDVVIGPAEDGGYVLIGMNRPCPELFRDIPWGSPRVLSETRSRIAHAGLRCAEIRLQWDLDRPEDLHRYRLLKGLTTDRF